MRLIDEHKPYTEMVDGRPVEHSYDGHVFTCLITDLPEEKQEVVFEWIDKYMVPRKTRNSDHTSYGLKHLLERDTGIYLHNNQFKDAMLTAGHEPVNHKALNWVFCISEKPLREREAERKRMNEYRERMIEARRREILGLDKKLPKFKQ